MHSAGTLVSDHLTACWAKSAALGSSPSPSVSCPGSGPQYSTDLVGILGNISMWEVWSKCVSKQSFKEEKNVIWQKWTKAISREAAYWWNAVFVFINKVKFLKGIDRLWHRLWQWFHKYILTCKLIKLCTLILQLLVY